MKKIVYFENKLIVDITTMELPSGYGKRINHHAKVYVFKDGSYIKSSETKGYKFKYVCNECGCEIESTTKPEYNIDKPYICNKCRGLNHNPFKGKKHSQEFKNRLSEERKGIWGVGEKNAMYGKSWKNFTTQDIIDEHRKKLSERFSGERNPMYGHSIKEFMTDEAYTQWRENIKNNGYHSKSKDEQKIISQRISEGQCALRDSNPEYYREIKSRGGKATMSKPQNYKKSSTEILIENWLIEHKVNYEYSPIMGGGDKIYQYDFIIHNMRILIEVQGDYWHGNPNFFNDDGSNGKRCLNDIQKKNMIKDANKLKFALNHNFEVIYIWEEEINKGDFSKLEKIL